MGTAINVGEQIIRWSWHIPLRSDLLGERLHLLLPCGIYSGFELAVAGSASVGISSGVLQIRDDTARTQIKCGMADDYVLAPVTPTASYIHAYWYYEEEKERYVDWVALDAPKGTSNNILSNYVCLGQALFTTGGSLSGFDYTYKQEAFFVFSLSLGFIDAVAGVMISGDGTHVYVDYISGGGNNIILISASSGTADHGLLTNLRSDDHSQYIFRGGTRPLGGDWHTGPIYGLSANTLTGGAFSAGKMWYGPGTTAVSGYIWWRTGQILSAGDGIDINQEVTPPYDYTIDSIDPTGSSLTEDIKLYLLAGTRGNVFYIQRLLGSWDSWGVDDAIGISAVSSKNVVIDPETLGYMGLKTNTSLGSARYAGVGLSVLGFGYAVAGRSAAAYLNSVQRFHDGYCIWSTVASLTNNRMSPGGFSNTEKLYIYCGVSGAAYYDETEIYNPITNAWSTGDDTGLTPRKGPISFGIFDWGYAVAGYDGSFLDDNERYDPTGDAWTSKTVLPISISGGAGFTIDGDGYQVQGRSSAGEVDTCYQYNFGTDAWSLRASALKAMCNVQGISLNGYGYSVGGTSGVNYHEHILEYSPSTNTWSVADNIPSGQSAPYAFELNGIGYIAGGISEGATLESTCYQLRNCAMYQMPGSFYYSVYAPHKVYVAANLNGSRAHGLPVWISTSAASGNLTGSSFGYQSQSMMTNNYDSLIKTAYDMPSGVSALSAYLPSGSEGWDYRIRVGIPRQRPTSSGYIAATGRPIWLKANDLPTTASYMFGSEFNGFGYIFESTTGARLNDSLDNWIVGFAGHTLTGSTIKSGFALEGFLYCTDENGALRYDDILNTWTSVTSPTPQGSAACFVAHGYGYRVGGASGDTSAVVILDDTFKYDPTADTWTAKDNTTYAVSEAGGFHLNGYGYVVGGLTAASAESDDLQRYNDSIDDWTNVANMSTARSRLGSAKIGQEGYACLGRSTDETVYETIIEKYSDKTSSVGFWLVDGYLEARDLPGVFAYDNNVYIVGGYTGAAWSQTVNKRIQPSETYKEPLRKDNTPDPEIDLTVTLLVEELFTGEPDDLPWYDR